MCINVQGNRMEELLICRNKMSKAQSQKISTDDLNTGGLLNEIEAISKALYLDKNPSKSSSSVSRSRPRSAEKSNVLESNLKSKHIGDDTSTKEKKSFWNWKPLKALSFVRNKRFNCCFTLEVLTIEGLPFEFNGFCLCVHWKRRDGDVVTRPIKVAEGVAEFEGKLTHVCSVYGSRSGPHHSAKYEAKHFLLYAALQGNPKLDLGKHRVDLTRLLPLTLEELEDEKNSGTWTTSFKLQGKAKGAVMNVSFGYLVLGDRVAPNDKNVLQLLESKSSVRTSVKHNQGDEKRSIHRAESFPTNLKSPVTSHSVDDVKVLHEIPPTTMSEFSSSVDFLYQKFDQEKRHSLVKDKCEINVSVANCASSLDRSKVNVMDENEDAEISVVEKGVEPLEKKIELLEDSGKLIDEPVVSTSDPCAQDGLPEETDIKRDKVIRYDCDSKEKDMYNKESLLQDLESVLSHVASLEKEGIDTPEAKSERSDQENQIEGTQDEVMQSVNLDDLADTVADEFLSMLGLEDSPLSISFDTEPESPRERLLREFQKEAEVSGCPFFGFDIDEEDMADYDDYAPTISGWEEFSESSDISPECDIEYPKIKANDLTCIGESDYPKIRANNFLPMDEPEYPKIRAKVMEDLETQALMEEWGLDENAFQSSPPDNAAGFGSPIDLPSKLSPDLPPLGEGLGPFIQTKSGGYLRSMNPILFKNAKSGGSLVMQVSSPVVVPAQLGSGVMEILQHLASVGLEKLSIQANKLMPLEDINGKTMQQIAWEARASERQYLLEDETEVGHVVPAGAKRVKGTSVGRKKKSSSISTTNEVDSEYVSLEDLAPLAMDKIEALSIEGLRIQSGMSDEEAPSNISTQSIGEFSALKGKGVGTSGSMGLDGAVGLQLLDVKDSETGDIDGLMGLSLSLDDWMRLDSGEIDEGEQMSERTSKLLAAHHANCTDLNFLRKTGGNKQGKASGGYAGLLGNNFTVALMVQLHDPLRNYEPVGTPMLALIQAERVFIPPKPKFYAMVSEARNNEDEDDELELVAEEDPKVQPKEEKTEEQDMVPQYKISEVHVSGLKNEPGKRKLWGSASQQQSGSRWLLGNGMGKSNKHPLM